MVVGHKCRVEHVALNAVAERQNISMNYLEQVFAALKKPAWLKV